MYTPAIFPVNFSCMRKFSSCHDYNAMGLRII